MLTSHSGIDLGGLVASRVLHWILDTTGAQSAWAVGNSDSASGSGGLAKYVFVGGGGGHVELDRGQEKANLRYALVGGGIGISPPWELLGGTVSTSDMPGSGTMRILRGERDFTSVADFNLPTVGVLGPCVTFSIDGCLLLGGLNAGVMLLGANHQLEGMLRRLGDHYHELMSILRERPPNGFWARGWDAVSRPIRGDVTLAKLAIDIAMILNQLHSGRWFRAALFSSGVEAAASDVGVTFSASISAYAGVVHA